MNVIRNINDKTVTVPLDLQHLSDELEALAASAREHAKLETKIGKKLGRVLEKVSKRKDRLALLRIGAFLTHETGSLTGRFFVESAYRISNK